MIGWSRPGRMRSQCSCADRRSLFLAGFGRLLTEASRLHGYREHGSPTRLTIGCRGCGAVYAFVSTEVLRAGPAHLTLVSLGGARCSDTLVTRSPHAH
jgi:hypothetical protein